MTEPAPSALTFALTRWLDAVRAADVPVDLGRDEARELAERELSKPSYDRDTPLTTRVIRWIAERIGDLVDAASGTLSSSVGVAAIVLVTAGLAAVILWRTGPLARTGSRRHEPVLPEHRRSAASHRAAADAAARDGDWPTAVTERYRATVAALEDRGVLDERSGRTADEAAREAGVVLPTVADELRAGADRFDAVRYGGVSAGPDDDTAMRRLDDDVAASRPRAAGRDAAEFAVPG